MTSKYYAIIMAGGVGSRFWPVSTTDFPKQFHDMLGTGETLIQKTFSRLSNIIPIENILILTNEKYTHLVTEQLPLVKKENIVTEPAMRNTAPCILYASLKIKKQNPDALLIVAPSDHWIEDEETFVENVQQAFHFCETENALMTLGIKPNFPNTGFGYIEYSQQDNEPIKKVVQFREKPTYETAKSFLKSGNFLWNAGIFVWSVKEIIAAFESFQPIMSKLFESGMNVYNTSAENQFISENYSKADNNVYVLPATFDWNDLGTWGSLHEKLEKDTNNNAVVNATVVLENASNNIIRTASKKLIVIDGINDFIIVDKDDVLLIYPKNKEQEIKNLVEKINN